MTSNRAAVSVLGIILSVNSGGISVCRTTGSYWVSSTLHASIGDDTFTDAKGSV